jgi:hypothetical protein
LNLFNMQLVQHDEAASLLSSQLNLAANLLVVSCYQGCALLEQPAYLALTAWVQEAWVALQTAAPAGQLQAAPTAECGHHLLQLQHLGLACLG